MSWVRIIHGRLSCDPPLNGYNGFSYTLRRTLHSDLSSALHLYTVLCTLLRVRLDDTMIPTSLILCLLFLFTTVITVIRVIYIPYKPNLDIHNSKPVISKSQLEYPRSLREYVVASYSVAQPTISAPTHTFFILSDLFLLTLFPLNPPILHTARYTLLHYYTTTHLSSNPYISTQWMPPHKPSLWLTAQPTPT